MSIISNLLWPSLVRVVASNDPTPLINPADLGMNPDGSGLDLESMLQGMDLSSLLGGGMEPSVEGVEGDVQAGFKQSHAALDPIAPDLEELEGFSGDAEQYPFQAETSRLMDIIVNSLYSNREVFLREIVSNSSDALSKAKHTALVNGIPLQDELAVYIEANKDAGTLSIFDNGIGMTRDDLRTNLGTIAQSGTHSFLEALADGSDVNVIGQFGVGFYSAFLVADDVMVQSRALGSQEEYLWRSQASEGFSISHVPNPDIDSHGTRVTLVLKPDAVKFSRPATIEKLLRQHSEFIDYPVYLKKKDSWSHINPARPIWQRPKEEVSENEYNQFYRKLSRDPKTPFKTIHYHGEGDVEFKALLYIPDDKDHELFGAAGQAPTDNVKLYSRGVLVSHEQGILPPWLGYIHGVVESNDLPLKVDREQLSNSKEMKLISKQLTKKIIDTYASILKHRDSEDADRLWSHHKTNLFLGCVAEQPPLKDKLTKLFRFNRLLATSRGEFTTLQGYMDRLESDDEPIYYQWIASPTEVAASPTLEIFKKIGRDVILVHGTLDDHCLESIGQIRSHPVISVDKADIEELLDLKDDEEDLALQRMLGGFMSAMADAIRQSGYSSFSEVALTSRLVDSPAAIFTAAGGVTAAQEKHIRNQSWFDEKEMGWRLGTKALSLNPTHPITKRLFAQFEEAGAQAPSFVEGSRMLYDYALLNGGHHLERPEAISRLVQDAIVTQIAVEDASDFSKLTIPPRFYEESIEDEQNDIQTDSPEIKMDEL